MKSEFQNVPAGRPVSIDQLKFYLEQGREIEFVYVGKEYFIAHTEKGRNIWSGEQKISADFKADQLEEFIYVTIQDRSLIDIFSSNEGLIQTIF